MSDAATASASKAPASNGFDVLRLFAAALVIWGHAYPITGHVSPGVFANGVQTIGVKIFFVISGFLITGSWIADPHPLRYARKRALRILPGLVVICVLTVIVLGAAVTSLPLADYFGARETWRYFWNVAMNPQYGLPGVFHGTIYGPAVNGSLWSLPVEVAMYVGVPLIVTRAAHVGRATLPLAAAVLLAASIMMVRLAPPDAPQTVFWGTSLRSALDVSYYFLAGAIIRVHRLDAHASVFAAGALMLICALFKNPILGEIALALTLPYAVVSVGVLRSDLVARALHGRDYSYGLYLYGFPMQQLVVRAFGAQSALFNAALAGALTLACAAISWHLIEQRVLALKPKRAVAPG